MLRTFLNFDVVTNTPPEVMQKLDERFIPMTQEMKDQVLEGKEVASLPLIASKDQKVILISSLKPGSYLVQVQNKSKILLNTKLVKL